MASVIFNSFKQRYLNGQVPRSDTWNFIPVNKNFTKTFDDKSSDFALEQYRTLDDFANHNSAGWDASRFTGVRRDITWFRPEDTSGTSKPMFITSGSIGEKGIYDKASNWEKFLQTDYRKDISANASINDYLRQGGFYYIRTKEELRWFADHSNTGNNRIIGVIGDDINGYIRGQIGKDEAYPYQGILDGNGHAIAGTIVCDNDDNGIVGVLGQDGIVKNFKLLPSENGSPSLLCKKLINIQHIKTDGRDINAGLLVGRNYGRVENIDGSKLTTFTFSGFVPQVYSVTNKSDDYNDFSTIRKKYDNGENFYFLNSWCINSPGNICPYVGYFAEGLYAQNAGGHGINGQYQCLEYAPQQQAQYHLGLTNDEIDLTEDVADIGWFIKYFGDNGKGYIAAQSRDNAYFKYLYENDKQRICTYDDPYGRNMVLIVGYDTHSKDEKDKTTRYFLEIHGTAYDKKAGRGNRRFYFHAGHVNLTQLPWLLVGEDGQFTTNKFTIVGASDVDEDGDPVDAIDMTQGESLNVDGDATNYDENYANLLKMLTNRRGCAYFWKKMDDGSAVPFNINAEFGLGYNEEINLACGFSWNNNTYDQSCFFRNESWMSSIGKLFPNYQTQGESVSHSEQDTGIETEYEVGEDDIKIYTLDGTPGKILTKNITNLSWTPKQEHSSTHVWDRMYCLLCADLTKKLTITLKDDNGVDCDLELMWNQASLEWLVGACEGNMGTWSSQFYKDRGEYVLLAPGYTYVQKDQNGNEGVYWDYTKVPMCYVIQFPRSMFDYVNWNDLIAQGHTFFNAFDNGYVAPTDTDPGSDNSILALTLRRAILQNLPRMTYGRFDIDPDHWSDDKDWSGWSLNDNQDYGTLSQYYNNRTVDVPELGKKSYWNNVAHTYRYWDITVNDDHVNEEAGTLEFNLIDTKSLMYRPFNHAFYKEGMPSNAYDCGRTFGKLWTDWQAQFNANPVGMANTYGTSLNAATTEMHGFALKYILDPRYYGLDYNGDWTSQVVRCSDWMNQGKFRGANVKNAYSFNGSFYYFFNSNYYKNTDVLHYNWNIEKMMFKDKRNGDLFEKYDNGTLNDGDVFKLDLAHAVLDKPLRMHNMARAAYNISPVVGANYGHITNVVLKTTRQNVGNFVGFLGGIAGKQERGLVENIRADVEDQIDWYQPSPKQPEGIDSYNHDEANAQISAYKAAVANDNFHVRYKMTPIIPGAQSDALRELGANPIDDGDSYRFYPAGIDEEIDTSMIPTKADWSANNQTVIDNFAKYLTILTRQGKRIYRVDDSEPNEVTFSNLHQDIYSYFTENPNFMNDNAFYEQSKPIMEYASEWYADNSLTGTVVYDDVVTFNLHPIFNAGGIFGRIIPTTVPNNKIELKSREVYNKAYLNDINITYKLSNKNLDDGETKYDTRDIHNAFGSLAGLMEIQTTEIGQRSLNVSDKLIEMKAIAAVGKSTYSADGLSGQITPIGFVAQQFTENTSIVATEGAGRSKGGNYIGAETDNTWAIDVPFIINTNMKDTDFDDGYAPINNVMAAFYGIDQGTDVDRDFYTALQPPHKSLAKNLGKNVRYEAEDVKNYTSGVIGDIVGFDGFYTNTSPAFTTWSPESIDMYGGKRNLQSVQSVFGSNTTFLPNIAYDRGKTARKFLSLVSASNFMGAQNQEQLDNGTNDCGKTSRIYYRDKSEFDSEEINPCVTAPFEITKLSDRAVFYDRPKTEDLYFSYSYSSTTAFVNDWTFQNQVNFTTALRDGDNRKIPDERKYVYGYVFSDYLTNSAEGFRYDKNYLHLGNSVSPAHIRRTIAKYGPFTTSSVSAAYRQGNEIVAADENHQFGGILVTDSNDRNVIFIDNTNGAELDNLSYNIQCPLVHYQNTKGGMLVEVK